MAAISTVLILASATSFSNAVGSRVKGRHFLIAAMFLAPYLAWAAPGMYQERHEFLAEVFFNEVPAPTVVWVTSDLREQATKILGHLPPSLRIRYWQRHQQSAWIIDEIGKERPITIGVGIRAGQIQTVRVLEFREAYGWEVRYPFFTEQFTGAELGANQGLTIDVDSISGATLSVSAVRRVAALALFLHEQTSPNLQRQALAKP